MLMDAATDSIDFRTFRGRVAGTEQALWEWSRYAPRARFLHPSLGNEAAAFVVSTKVGTEGARWALYYRCHAWLLALGVPLALVLEEINGKQDSPLGGR